MSLGFGRKAHKTTGAEPLAAFAEHERLTAERLKWWSLFLVREQRRLEGIAEAIQGTTRPDLEYVPPLDEIEGGLPPEADYVRRETVDAFLERLDEGTDTEFPEDPGEAPEDGDWVDEILQDGWSREDADGALEAE